MSTLTAFESTKLTNLNILFQFRDIPPGPPPPSSNMRGLPGPQVPPRNPPAGSGGEGTGSSTGGSSDRLLSVSGKKKCSHCKEELGK